jgi:hypothetical protein
MAIFSMDRRIISAGLKPWGYPDAQSPAAAWLPSQLSDLVLWLDAADSSTITLESGAVSEWRDKSGNDNHAAQSTSIYRPAVASSEQNSLDVLRFSATDGSLIIPSTIMSSGGNMSVFAVCNQTGATPATNAHVLAQVAGVLVKSTQYSTGKSRFQPYIDGSYRLAESSSALSGWAILASVKDSTAGKLAIDGTTDGTYSYTGNIETPANDFYIGRLPGVFDTEFFGDIAEILIIPSAVSTEGQQRIEGYLAHKWGLEANLPSGHPYKDSAP